MRFGQLAAVGAVLLLPTISRSQDSGPSRMFLDFIRRQAAELRAKDQPPATLAEWEQRRAALRDRMQEAWGDFPLRACPLKPRLLGTLSRDGYRVEKLIFQTRPGMTLRHVQQPRETG